MLEPHGTIVRGRLKGTRAALIERGENFDLVRVFDCKDPSFTPAKPIQVTRGDFVLDAISGDHSADMLIEK